MTTSAKFITFEGIDGAGKSSHIAFVADYLRENNFEVVTTREPGGTPLGEAIRTLVLNETMHPESEALLVFAARNEHLVARIEPALERGAWVICDRFTDSSYAYQCGGRELNPSIVGRLEQLVHGNRQPDLTLLFDAPVTLARERVEKNTLVLDKFEREQANFFHRVRDAYLQRASEFPERIKVVDSSQSMAAIRADLLVHLDLLRQSRTSSGTS
jgi:dTMP kinase